MQVKLAIFKQIQSGSRVRVLQPHYVAGKTGIVLSPEILVDAQLSDRWLIQLDSEDIILSLSPDEFLVFGAGVSEEPF